MINPAERKIKAVLFDLDGTLLPLDTDEFAGAYFKSLSKFMTGAGLEPERFGRAILSGISAMMKNDGARLNGDVFWDVFLSVNGELSDAERKSFDLFYETEFPKLKEYTGYTPSAEEAVRLLRSEGIRVVIATQPVFPAVATANRILWAGVDTEDIEFFTSFENSSFCKPSIKYYEKIAEELGLSPSECLMVGNDVDDDMIAEALGMSVFLLTDKLINRRGADISEYKRGGFPELIEYLKSI